MKQIGDGARTAPWPLHMEWLHYLRFKKKNRIFMSVVTHGNLPVNQTFENMFENITQ